METRRLRAFICIVDIGSLTRAAQVLHIAQPALSQQVVALEEEFGAQLLIRSRQGVVPTSAGRALYRHAQILLKQLEHAQEEINLSSDKVSGLVQVGLPLSAAAVLSVPLLRAVNERHSEITLGLVDGMSGSLLNELAMNGRLDISLLPGNVVEQGLKVEHLITERLALVTYIKSEFGQTDDAISVRDLEGHPFVLPAVGNRVRQEVDAGFAKVGLRPNVVAEMNSVYSLCAAVAANLGSAIVPLSAAAYAVGHELRIRPIVDPEMTRPLYLAISDAAPLTPANAAIYKMIKEVTHHLVESGQWPGAKTA